MAAVEAASISSFTDKRRLDVVARGAIWAGDDHIHWTLLGFIIYRIYVI
tara:strand:+ start:7 stop:153 length:147 start_codon:yes stop_codon:yes gene_type:complete